MTTVKNLSIYCVFLCFTVAFILNVHNLVENSYMFVSYELFDPYYDLSLGFLWFVVFTLIIIKTLPKEYAFIWFIKAFITLIVMLVYEWHYKLDAFVYFAAAIDMKNAFISGGNTMLMAYFNHYLTYLIGESYQALKLLHSLIGFLGLIFFYKSFELIMKEFQIEINKLYLYFFFLFPTVLFWSSILGKDPINLFILGMTFYSIINIIKKFHYSYLLLFIISIIGLYFLRYWYLFIFAVTILMYVSYFYMFRKNWYLFLGSILIFIIIVSNIDNQYSQTILNKLNTFSSTFAFGGSKTDTYTYESLGDYFYYFVPNVFTTLFRPMIFDVTNPFTFVSACENIVLFLLFVKYILFNISNLSKNKYMVFLLFYIFSWLLFYVMVSPGNLGTAVRFKLQILPVILIVVGYSMHSKGRQIS